MMSDAPVDTAEQRNEAQELKERFERARRYTVARSRIEKLAREGKLREAAAVANQIGEPLPRNQVVRVDFTRGRA